METKIEPSISQKRRENLTNALPQINWDFDNATLKNKAYEPTLSTFDIPGSFRDIKVIYRHQHPGGSHCYLHAFRNGRKVWSLRDAYLHKAPLINKVLNDLSPLLALPAPTVKKATLAKNTKSPGVISTILEIIKSGPHSKAEILAELKQAFPDRDEKAMKATINAQLPNRLAKDKKVTISKNDAGQYFVNV